MQEHLRIERLLDEGYSFLSREPCRWLFLAAAGKNHGHLRTQPTYLPECLSHARARHSEIEKNGFNLNISRYVDTTKAEEQVDLSTALLKLRAAEQQRDEAKTAMDGFLRGLGYE